MYRSTIYIPENLDLENILSAEPPAFNYKTDKGLRILNLITEIPTYNQDLLNRFGYTIVNAQKVQNKIHNYNLYIEYFITSGIIQTDGQYIKGKKSRGFKFTEKYQTPIKAIEIGHEKPVNDNNNYTKFEKRMIKKYGYLYKWFNDDLNIDFDKAYDYISIQLKSNKAMNVNNALMKFNIYYRTLHRFKIKNFFFVVDSNVLRLHTNIVGIKSELRNYITYRGTNLVSIDIKNSQPFLSTVLLDDRFWNSKFDGNLNINSITNKRKFKHLQSNKSLNNLLSYIMLVQTQKSLDGRGFQQYINEVINGTLYEYIAEQVKINISNRKKLKETIFRVLYTANQFIGQRAAEPKRIFRSIFPEVYQVFNLVKRNDKTALARLLQTIESKMMLKVIAKRISKEKPDMPLFTIHDSLVCPVENEEYCANVIKDEMIKAIGFSPQLKFEYWSPENVTKK